MSGSSSLSASPASSPSRDTSSDSTLDGTRGSFSNRVKILLISHVVVFTVGVVTGVRIHAKELDGYRQREKDSKKSSLRKNLYRCVIASGLVGIGSMVFTLKRNQRKISAARANM
mmetsp:Transcript_20103/g.26037  ORF Transcript_20103/g.26037 Transcript_20103/m.26037 type:complete len:115 (-) Transcript_20103:1403-1747(-)